MPTWQTCLRGVGLGGDGDGDAEQFSEVQPDVYVPLLGVGEGLFPVMDALNKHVVGCTKVQKRQSLAREHALQQSLALFSSTSEISWPAKFVLGKILHVDPPETEDIEIKTNSVEIRFIAYVLVYQLCMHVHSKELS